MDTGAETAMANAAAAADKTGLASREMDMLKQYADVTASHYCAGCADICESAVNASVPVCDVMRHLMYARGYGDPDRAIDFFRRMPSELKNNLVSADYSEAERKCPNNMPIARLMKEASAFFS